MRIRITGGIIALAFPAQAGAQEVLWQDLLAGDQPATVAAKMSAMPEVKRVKVKQGKKGPALSISWRDGGVKIFGQAFEVRPEFSDGKLARVLLVANDTCAADGFGLYERIAEQLVVKYPEQAAPGMALASESDFARADIEATSQRFPQIASALRSESVVVQIAVMFYHVDPPATTYAYDNLSRALRDVAWSLYRTRVADCGGTGNRRMNIKIEYMTPQAFEIARDIRDDEQKREEDAAASRL